MCSAPLATQGRASCSLRMGGDRDSDPVSWASSAAVRRSMIGNRSRDTAPERALRSELHRLGLRFRVDARPVPAIPRRADVVLRGDRVAVFLDGCFWHGCPDHFRPPATNADYWAAKIAGNRARDASTGLPAAGRRLGRRPVLGARSHARRGASRRRRSARGSGSTGASHALIATESRRRPGTFASRSSVVPRAQHVEVVMPQFTRQSRSVRSVQELQVPREMGRPLRGGRVRSAAQAHHRGRSSIARAATRARPTSRRGDEVRAHDAGARRHP